MQDWTYTQFGFYQQSTWPHGHHSEYLSKGCHLEILPPPKARHDQTHIVMQSTLSSLMMSILLVSIWVTATLARLGIQDIEFLSILIHSFHSILSIQLSDDGSLEKSPIPFLTLQEFLLNIKTSPRRVAYNCLKSRPVKDIELFSQTIAISCSLTHKSQFGSSSMLFLPLTKCLKW